MLLQYLKSKTVWKELLGSAAIIGVLLGVDIPDEVRENLAAGLAGLFMLVGIIIRRFTTKPLSEK